MHMRACVPAVCVLQGTQQYKAPEVYNFNHNGNNNTQNGQHNPNEPGYASAPVDVWSAGVLLYAALNRRYPFNTDHIYNAQDVETYLRGPRPLRYYQPLSPNCMDLIEKMLAPQAADRINISDILDHAFFLEDIERHHGDPRQLRELCFDLASPCVLSAQQLEGVIAHVHAQLVPQAAQV
jgi:serine/threonine protein kinase